jgi:sec-independent protein translocase protein TatB
MFEFDAGKFVLIAIVALLVIGPKELPRVMRQVGQALSKLRRLSSDFQAQFMEAMREADLEEVRTEAAKIAAAAKLDHGLDPLAGIRAELTKSIEAPPETPATILPSHVDPLAEALAHHSEAAEEPIQESIEARETATDSVPEPAASPETAPLAPTSFETPEAEPVTPAAANVTPLRQRG